MKPNFKLLTALILPFFSHAQDKGLDQIIDEKFGEATGWFVDFIFYQIEFSKDVKVFWVLFPLIFGAAYFTLYFKFINWIIHLGHLSDQPLNNISLIKYRKLNRYLRPFR